jgi:uncharacterized Zn finger protein
VSEQPFLSLRSLLEPDRLRRLAGDAYFARGEAYRSEGRVGPIRFDGEVVVATVSGTEDYRVMLWVEGEELGYSCTCPLGEEGVFCKHCVAAGLVWRVEYIEAGRHSDKEIEGGGGIGEIRTYLSALPAAALVELIVEQTRADDALYRRLRLRAGEAKGEKPDRALWRGAFDEAVEAHGYVSYGEARACAADIDEIVDELDRMMEAGHADTVIELAGYGMEELTEAQDNVDDSDGEIGAVIERLRDLHLRACLVGSPDPEALGEQLLDWRIEGVVDRNIADYAPVLGEAGLARYREQAEAMWRTVPALGPNGTDPERYGRRYAIRRVMEELARQSGDVEALVEVRRRDLSQAGEYLAIAQIYQAAGQEDRALEWAEEGRRIFAATSRDTRLRDFVAELYHDRGRHGEAMDLAWEAFTKRPDLRSYQALKGHADKAAAWDDWRERALAFLRTGEDGAASKRTGGPSPPRLRRDRSDLVEILLWEGRSEEAWREAEASHCTPRLRLALAKTRESSHPDDAIAIYRAEVADLLTTTSYQAYTQAVELIARIGRLMREIGAEAEFAHYLVGVRAAQKRKRNFIKLLDSRPA